MVHRWLNNILSGSLTRNCQLCGSVEITGDIDLCPDCYKDLPWLPAACPRCATPVPSMPVSNDMLCGQCQQNSPAFDNSQALFHYESPLDYLIQGLKFHGQLSHANLLGKLMARHFVKTAHKVDCLIPVPLHPKRLRERGFNQALELARPIAKQLNIKIDTQRCQRVRHTDGQADLSLAKRHANVRNAFSVCTNVDWDHVVIIDDVMTSGQTVNTLAKALKHSGVNKVSVWSCCRATTNK